MAINTDGTGPNRDRGALTDDQRNLTRVSQGTAHPVDFLAIAKEAETINSQFNAELRTRWERAYRAYRSEHFAGSKYKLPQWAARSKLFRPKTRSGVRSAMSTAAAALFSTSDIVNVSATLESDPAMLASAKVNQELLNYRLDRTSPRGGMPWFMIAMGACFNATMTGVCCSKQFWDYRTKTRAGIRMVARIDETGQPMIDPGSGQPLMMQESADQQIIVTDRPMIDLVPSENVMLDLAAPWYDPVQLSAYFSVGYPMLVTDLKDMIAAGTKQGASPSAGVKWLPVEDAALTTVQADYDAQGVRMAREGGQDTKDRRAQMSGDYSIAWVRENFFRYRGEDYHFWSVGTDIYLSEPIFTELAYPHLDGSRPYAYGYGAIEPHLIYPQSAVESWQPLQQEANDIVNLRLDSLKQALEPMLKVKSGSVVDLTQLQPGKRGAAGSTVLVRNMEDLEFTESPAPAGQAYGEMQNINADFDELAGLFSGSSVNTNRQLGETVGGLRLLSGSAGSIKEFDLRVWVETWVEVALRQVVRLEQYYESDETILAIAGQRAKIYQKFGVTELTDQHLTQEVTLRVNVGIGATDPMQKMQKMTMGLTTLGGLVPFFDRPVKLNAEEITNEIFGLMGYKDGERFIVLGDPNAQQPDPGAQDAQTKMMLEKMRGETQMQLAQMNNASAEERDRMKAQVDLLTAMLQMQSHQQEQQQAQQHQQRGAAFQHFSKMVSGAQQQEGKASLAKLTKGSPTAGGDGAPNGGGDAYGDVGARLSQLVNGVSSIGQRLDQLTVMVQDIGDEQAAPVEMIRDAAGKPVGVNKRGKVRKIIRDPQTNRVMGLGG